MPFVVTYSQIGDDPDGLIHRQRDTPNSPVDPQGSTLDCGRVVEHGGLLWLHAIHWNRETACLCCWNHLLTLVDGEDTTWLEAPTVDGEPSNLFYIAPRPGEPDEIPDELTPMAAIVREFGLSEIT